ncbi:MAG: UDP-glucose 4-epimerase GalE [Myxococcales bacterium]|nr:UDP-glucose 4-epimerase GalE [Myxococcota bacterium]MDW8280332.1 UDP-glucose 4-epimerase GalE [Myxococcales bacterium]
MHDATAEGPILITGGAGYVGAHVNLALLGAGLRTLVFDNLRHGHREFVPPQSTLIQGDLLDREAIARAISEHAVVAVVHCAAYTAAGESVYEPDKYYRNNLIGSLNLLSAMVAAGCRRMVFSSSAAVYGRPETVPIAESAPLRPLSPYGHSKLMMEQIIADYGRAYGLQYVHLRYFNAAGADPSGTVGEDHRPETHLIPLVLDVALGRLPAVTVHGDDYPTPDGTCIRDYVHVVDLAEAHRLALQRLLAGGDSGVYNLGSERGSSVLEVIAAAREVTGRPVPLRLGPRRPGDPDRLVADSTRAQRELGWCPQRGDVRVILEDAWRFHRCRFGTP